MRQSAPKRGSLIVACVFAVAMLVIVSSCGLRSVMPVLELPEPQSIIVYDDDKALIIRCDDERFEGLYSAISRFPCTGALASSVDPKEDLIAGAAMELDYGALTMLSVPNGDDGVRERECDRVLLCFEGDHAGEVLFGKGGRYENGTVAHPFVWEVLRPLWKTRS